MDWAEFKRVLLASRWGYVLLAMVAGIVAFVIRSLRWRLLMLPVDLDIKRIDCYDGFTIGRLCDLVVPHVGEFVRCGYVLSPRMTYDKALGTVVLERAWDIIMLALLILVLLLFRGDQYGAFFAERIFNPVADKLGISPLKLLFVFLFLPSQLLMPLLNHRSPRCPAASQDSCAA